MFENIAKAATVLGGTYKAASENQRISNEAKIKLYIEMYGKSPKEEFTIIKNNAKNGDIQISDETLKKLLKEYDSKNSRNYTLSFYNQSSEETKVLRESLTYANVNKRVELVLDFMNKQDNHKLGFCRFLWSHFVIKQDLFTPGIPKKLVSQTSGTLETPVETKGMIVDERSQLKSIKSLEKASLDTNKIEHNNSKSEEEIITPTFIRPR